MSINLVSKPSYIPVSLSLVFLLSGILSFLALPIFGVPADVARTVGSVLVGASISTLITGQIARLTFQQNLETIAAAMDISRGEDLLPVSASLTHLYHGTIDNDGLPQVRYRRLDWERLPDGSAAIARTNIPDPSGSSVPYFFSMTRRDQTLFIKIKNLRDNEAEAFLIFSETVSNPYFGIIRAVGWNSKAYVAPVAIAERAVYGSDLTLNAEEANEFRNAWSGKIELEAISPLMKQAPVIQNINREPAAPS